MSSLGPVLVVLAIISGITATLDMGMNGSRYAGWAPWGLGIAAVCVVILSFGGLS